MEENKISTSPSRKAGKTINGKQITVTIPLLEPGETTTLEVPRYNITILVERGAAETQEQLRERYTVVAPTGTDRRLHAARIGVGAVKGKRISITLCTQDGPKEKAIQSGNRIDNVPLDIVTCSNCVKVLQEEGIEIKGASA